MFCPQCKYEYRDGFTRCSDCDMDLVHSLDAPHINAPQPAPETDSFRTIWTGEQEGNCVAFCQELRDIGIRYKVSQTEVSRSVRMGVVWQYKIAIASSDYEKAKELLQIDNDPDDASHSDEQAQASDNEPAVIELSPDREDDLAEDNEDDESAERRAYSEDWYAEDATAEIWTQPAGAKTNPLNIDPTSMVELSLRENFIHFRSDRDEEGVCRIFVLPEDEARAREIVREIEDSSPRK
jgi:hypothetical protein